jgi:hypothetical protein
MGKDELTGAEEAFTQDGSNLAAGTSQFGQVNVTLMNYNVIIHLYLLMLLSSNLMRALFSRVRSTLSTNPPQI